MQELLRPGAADALAPAGVGAERIASLWWVAIAIAAIVYALTVGALAWGAWRARAHQVPTDAHQLPGDEPRVNAVIVGATAVTVLLLFGFLVTDLITSQRLSAMEKPRALTIHITGHQWWWHAEYADSIPSQRLSTANEIHIPAGTPVQLVLQTADVIHSFWAPSLQGKRDLMPHHANLLFLNASQPGEYAGPCAEFCGLQHARMTLRLVVDPPAAYTRWYAAQLTAAPTPTDSLRHLGEAVFTTKACPLCHTVRGTAAGGSVGPDLTHVASRRWLAAGAIPNTDGTLASWITDPQAIKPGTQMPPTRLTAAELTALVAYLRGLR